MNRTRCRAAGFTLVELLVVMGILTGFLLMLVQLVDGGLRMFRDGESSQALADAASEAQRAVSAELSQLRGSATAHERQLPEDRLVVQLLGLGLPPASTRLDTHMQVLRGAVRLAPEREEEVLDLLLAQQALADNPQLAGDALVAEVQKRRLHEPLRGVGNLLLVPWLQEGEDDALLELRVGWFLPGQKFPVRADLWVDPFRELLPGGPTLPATLVYGITRPLVRNLLHIEFALWSQRTTSWGGDGGPLGEGVDGRRQPTDPLPIWDSARGGWLVDWQSGGAFAFDRGAASEEDPSDDIQPHAIQVRCVVAQSPDQAPEGLLARGIGADDQSLWLYDGNSFPGDPDGGWIKVDREWLRYASRDGDRLIGLRRGQRCTRADEHQVGTRVHVGRTVEFVVPMLHAKDDWNGD